MAKGLRSRLPIVWVLRYTYDRQLGTDRDFGAQRASSSFKASTGAGLPQSYSVKLLVSGVMHARDDIAE